MDDKDHGQKVAGRVVWEAEGVGVIALVFAGVSMSRLSGASEMYAVAAFLFVAAVAFGLVANAVLRR
jgi:hypothetical protein